MGNVSSYVFTEKAFFVYKRLIDTDAYDNEPTQKWSNISKECALSQFKHEMFAYATGKYEYNKNTKAIYLYYGSTRVMKVGIVNNQVLVESSHDLAPFLEADEQAAPGRGASLQKEFTKIWFRNYARLNVNTVGFVRTIKN